MKRARAWVAVIALAYNHETKKTFFTNDAVAQKGKHCKHII